ncbi:MAG: response regulator, partial [Hyphomicrobiaceae bacterium]|nr:response regulator [Hyphomicrobiaceae bacterium]
MAEDYSFSREELPEDASLIVVDDDVPFQQRLSRAMEQRGFEVRSANTVADGLALIRERPPAFAIVDMRLDDGNGLDMIAELARLRPNARTIVLTGYGNIATAVSAVKLGAVDYLAKPADADEVTDALL